MKKIVLICLFVLGCGAPDHERERKEVCDHSEGFASGQCAANDDFSPLTCITALDQFENWWRSDAQTDINTCLSSSACYPSADGTTGPSIVVPLQSCLASELNSLQPTDAQNKAVTRYCIKASACDELQSYTISGCQQILLNPFDQGDLFLMMNDQVATQVGDCDKSQCGDLDPCVIDAFQTVGALSDVYGSKVNQPQLMK